ncbi:hypothetical protein [Variovorax sp. V15]|uniref:hypothetical protein n=1 Tax=Variovorax sp. V15 TaxID=3065952 RepID=UPI0034E8B12D
MFGIIRFTRDLCRSAWIQMRRRAVPWAFCAIATVCPSLAMACDLRAVELLEQIPPVKNWDGKSDGSDHGPMYWDPAARTSRLAYLKPYWYARAGCEEQAQAAAMATEKGAAYAAAGAMRRSGEVDVAGYALLEARGLEHLVEPLLVAPRHAGLLERYARRTPKPDAHDLPSEEAFNLLYKKRDYARAVALVRRLDPQVLQDSGMLELRYAYANYRLGRRRTAWALMRPFLRPIPNEIPYFSARAGLVYAFAQDGDADTAWQLVVQAPASYRGVLLRNYVEASGDFSRARKHQAWMTVCQRAALAAMEGAYLRSIDLADLGQCEKLYSFVPPVASQRLAQRYTAAELYSIAAMRGEGPLFRQLAWRAGATSYYYTMPTVPVALALVAANEDMEARRILLDDASLHDGRRELKRDRFWPPYWREIAELAGPSFDFPEWIRLHLEGQGKDDGYIPDLVYLVQSFAKQRPAQAIAWYEENQVQLSERQKGDAIIGLIRGIFDEPLYDVSSKFKPLAPAYKKHARS